MMTMMNKTAKYSSGGALEKRFDPNRPHEFVYPEPFPLIEINGVPMAEVEKPMSYRLLVQMRLQRLPSDALEIPASATEDAQAVETVGKILAIGDGAFKKNGEYTLIESERPKVGDMVRVRRMDAQTFRVRGVPFAILSDTSIHSIVKDTE